MKHPPIKGFKNEKYPEGSITQWYGENPALYGTICYQGSCLTGHNGYDIVAPWGTPLYAVDDGQIVDVKESEGGYGKHVRLLSNNFEYTYGHLSRIDVKLGQQVKAGEQVGLMGNTGFVVSGATPFWKHNPYAGTHLHLGKREFKPRVGSETFNIQYLNSIQGNILNYDNGLFGSIPINWDELTVGTPVSPRDLTIMSIQNQLISLLKQLIAKYQGHT